MIPLIETTDALAALCDRLAAEPFVTVDTEFMRERTYWPHLCLVQIAGAEEACLIDPEAPGIDLAPLYALMNNPSVLKVFHAARQDLEIFFHATGSVPHPIFDTQVAAMVCGFGDSVSYEALVSKFANARLDKASRFTDWSARPLTERQKTYALADVTHLRVIYGKLAARLGRTGRAGWIAEEMAILTDPAVYRSEPEEAWRRLKPRSNDRRFLHLVRALAAWREREAQTRDLPRNRVLRDEAILEIAALAPKGPQDIARTRSLGKGQAESRIGRALVEVTAAALAEPESSWPPPPPRQQPLPKAPVADLLRVLLKQVSETHQVAAKLIASSAELEQMAAEDEADVPALRGWRRELFGDLALDLKKGRLALTGGNGAVEMVRRDA